MEEEIKGDYGPANIKYMQSNQMAPFGVDKYKLQGEVVPRFDIINGFDNLPRIQNNSLEIPEQEDSVANTKKNSMGLLREEEIKQDQQDMNATNIQKTGGEEINIQLIL